MFIHTSRPARAGAALLGALAATAIGATAPAAGATRDSVLAWYDATATAVATAGASAQVTNNRTWAIGWLAAARAQNGSASPTYQRAALAGAVHRTLVVLIPAQTAAADAVLATELTAIPDGPAEDHGLAAGRAAADSLIAERTGDGLDPASVNATFPLPSPAPGIWQPTPPAYAPATQYGNRVARPFILRSADQFRLGPPPPLRRRHVIRADLSEVPGRTAPLTAPYAPRRRPTPPFSGWARRSPSDTPRSCAPRSSSCGPPRPSATPAWSRSSTRPWWTLRSPRRTPSTHISDGAR